MAEYIDREFLYRTLWCDTEPITRDRVLMLVRKSPAADVKPVWRGRWINFYGDWKTAECGNCGHCYEVIWDGESCKMLFDEFCKEYKYCPHCGARMNLMEDDNEDV